MLLLRCSPEQRLRGEVRTEVRVDVSRRGRARVDERGQAERLEARQVRAPPLVVELDGERGVLVVGQVEHLSELRDYRYLPMFPQSFIDSAL